MENDILNDLTNKPEVKSVLTKFFKSKFMKYWLTGRSILRGICFLWVEYEIIKYLFL